MADPWAGHYAVDPMGPWGDRDQAMRQAGTTPAGYYQQMYNIPTGAGATSYTRGGGTSGPGKRGFALTTGTVAAYNNPQTFKEFSALSPDQKRAYMQANPNWGNLQRAMNQQMSDQGYGPGGSSWQGQPTGGYVPPDAGGSSPGVALGDLSTWGTPSATTPGTGGGMPNVLPNPAAIGVSGTPSPSGAGGGQVLPQAGGGPSINASTGNIEGLPPMNPGETSMGYMLRIGMSPADAQTALTISQQHPEMTFQQILTQGGYGFSGSGGAGTGGTAANVTRAPTGATGALPPINPGEDSMAYMLRIGMSQEQANAALAMAKANPGMSFQDIMAALQGGGGGSTGNTGVSIGDIATGSGGLTGALGGVNGVPGYGGTFNLENWKDPGYDFRLAEGKKLLEGSAAARGNLLSGPTLKAITNYGQDAASQEYLNAYNRFTGNRAFNYGVDVGDRAFDYLARTGDRDFGYKTQVGDRDYNKSLIDSLIQSGQYGTTGAADVNRVLAVLTSQNLLSGGQANAASTIGGGNAITNAVSEMIKQWLGTQAVNKATGK